MAGLSRLFLDHRPWLSDLEINPLIVLAKDEGVRAVDVRVVAAQAIGADRMDARRPPPDGLNFELPEEIRMLKDTVRKFVDREMIPIERTAPRRPQAQARGARASAPPRPRSWGSPATTCRSEYGGLGMGLVAKVTVWAELGRTIALPSRGVDMFGPNVSPILYHLNDEQKKKYLLPTIRGELNWCLAQTEPDAGGDPGGMRTTAVRQGDHYVINGTKRFITGADEAHFTQLIAATDRAKGSHGGISAFIVDMKAPGVKLAARAGAGGRRPAVGDRLRGRQGAGREPHRRGRRRLHATRSTGSTSAASATARAASA